MTAKAIVNVALLVFIGAAAIYLAIGEMEQTDESLEVVASRDTVSDQGSESTSGARIVFATYYHGHARCQTCNRLQSYSEEVIKTRFADLLGDGRLVWRALNYEEPEHAHAIDDYSLPYQSLILQEEIEGQPGEFQNLNRIWELVGDKPAFMEYVESEVRAFLARPQ